MNIGILGFQGAFLEHKKILERMGCNAEIVRYASQLSSIDGLIIPGGESTTMGKLLNMEGMMAPLRDLILKGLPVWGTCAGMILLAKHIESQEESYLSVMDITVKRNAYGRQIDSFQVNQIVEDVSDMPIPLVFIRAPYVLNVGNGVKVLAKVDDNIVAVRQRNILATSFHPELTDNTAFHDYFRAMCALSV